MSTICFISVWIFKPSTVKDCVLIKRFLFVHILWEFVYLVVYKLCVIVIQLFLSFFSKGDKMRKNTGRKDRNERSWMKINGRTKEKQIHNNEQASSTLLI